MLLNVHVYFFSQVNDLKKELKSRGLSTVGNKQELIDRMINHSESSGLFGIKIYTRQGLENQQKFSFRYRGHSAG